MINWKALIKAVGTLLLALLAVCIVVGGISYLCYYTQSVMTILMVFTLIVTILPLGVAVLILYNYFNGTY